MKKDITNDLRMNGEAVVLCGGKACCPELSIQDDQVTITDDHGGVVKMEKSQAALITKALSKLENRK